MSSLKNCLDRAEQIARHGKVYTSDFSKKPSNNYNYNLGKLTERDPSDRSPSPVLNEIHEISSFRKTPAALVKADPACQMAIKQWGVFPGALVNLAKSQGIATVRQWLSFVHGIEDSYFDLGAPVGPQRGAYFMACVQSPYREEV